MHTSKLPKNTPCHLQAHPLEGKRHTMVTEFDIPSSPGVSPPFNLARFTLACGTKTDIDQHLVKEVWLIARGSGVVNYKGKPISVSAGDAVYFESNESHQLLNNGNSTIEVFSIWWKG